MFWLVVLTSALSVAIVATCGIRGAGPAILVTFLVSGVVNVAWHIIKFWRG